MNEQREWTTDQREKKKKQTMNENDRLLHEADTPQYSLTDVKNKKRWHTQEMNGERSSHCPISIALLL